MEEEEKERLKSHVCVCFFVESCCHAGNAKENLKDLGMELLLLLLWLRLQEEERLHPYVCSFVLVLAAKDHLTDLGMELLLLLWLRVQEEEQQLDSYVMAAAAAELKRF